VVPEKQWVSLAVLRRARGIRGELFAESMGSPLERFTPGLPVTIFDPGATQERPAEIERSWAHNGRLVLKLRGVDTRSDAEALQGWEVRIPLEERPPAPAGEYYLSDLIGFEVFTRDDRNVGTVTGWLDSGGPALLEVMKDDAEILVPLVPEICVEVDTGGRRITVQLPEGLEELNRA
jgi:16S rRNA processing protein RimM